MSIAFNYGAASHLGKVRKSNQDSGYAGPNLLVLADGMGGPAGGDIASAVAVDYLQHLDQQAQNSDSALQNLVQAEATAHDELCDHSNANPELTGLGTTCIAILRTDTQLTLTHIGDSRAYLLREGELYQVTKDHSYVQQLIDEGRITTEEAARHPHRSVLLRVLGDSQANPEVDTMVIEPEIGDRWLLCSDGLCGYVCESDFKQVLIEETSPQDISDKLVELALKAGGIDNVTCVVADIVAQDTENLPKQPIIVGSAADSKKLAILRKHLQQSLQSESILETSLENSDLLQDQIITPAEGVEISDNTDNQNETLQSGDSLSKTSTPELDSEAEPTDDGKDASEKKIVEDSLEAFAPEDLAEKKKSRLALVFVAIMLLIAICLGTYMVMEFFGYHIPLPGLSSQVHRGLDFNCPFISHELG